MGQVASECARRDKDTDLDRDSTSPPSQADVRDVDEIHEKLQTVVASIEGLQHENEQLHRANTDLQRDLTKLRNALTKRRLLQSHGDRAWRMFDVVEQHYKQLEHHRQRRETGSDLPTDAGSVGDLIMAGSGCSIPEGSDGDPAGSVELSLGSASGLSERSEEWRNGPSFSARRAAEPDLGTERRALSLQELQASLREWDALNAIDMASPASSRAPSAPATARTTFNWYFTP